MAGLGTRLYPVSIVLPKGLMPFVLPDGRLTTELQLIANALLDAGIEQIGLVVSPEQEAVYRQFLSGDSARYGAALQRRAELHAAYEALQRLNACITLIVQPQPYGFGHAVWCARDFAQGEPVLVMLGDHIPLATGSVSPVQQALAMYERLRAPLYAVYRVPLHAVERYGILRGSRPRRHGSIGCSKWWRSPRKRSPSRRCAHPACPKASSSHTSASTACPLPCGESKRRLPAIISRAGANGIWSMRSSGYWSGCPPICWRWRAKCSILARLRSMHSLFAR
jgi:UTP-glucose-1-phosphate uridylyltransferase